MRTRMYGGVTGKAGDSLPMSIGTNFAHFDFSVTLGLKAHGKKSDENLSCLR